MRQLQAILLALLGGCLGCGGADSIRPPAPTPSPAVARDEDKAGQGVVLDVAVLECPYGDPFLSDELWQGGDEHVDLDVQPVLEENGLRVCRIGGLLPARLQALLSSQQSCPQPRRIRAEMERATELLVGPQHAELSIQYRDTDRDTEHQIQQAQCLFEVVPALGEEDTVKLRLRPRVRHGRTLLAAHVANDPGGALHWSIEPNEPTVDFPALVWDLDVRSDDLICIGARLDRPGTIGPACFIHADGQGRKQTILVLKASVLAGAEPVQPASQTPPLAAQASLTARGCQP